MGQRTPVVITRATVRTQALLTMLALASLGAVAQGAKLTCKVGTWCNTPFGRSGLEIESAATVGTLINCQNLTKAMFRQKAIGFP